MPSKPLENHNQKVTDLMINLMEQDMPPFPKEWNDPTSRMFPWNIVTMEKDPTKTYGGSNRISCWVAMMVNEWKSNAFIGINDIKALGANLIKLPDDAPNRANNTTGQSLIPIINATPYVPAKYKKINEDIYRCQQTGSIYNKNEVTRITPKIVNKVANIAQVEGLPDVYYKEQKFSAGSIKDAEQMLKNTGISENVSEDNSCYYIPSKDKIFVVSREHFTSDDVWYSTRFHEFGHATGHKIRLDRDQTGRMGSEEYAFEELVAELTSAFVCARFKIPCELRHAAYLKSYIKVLKANPKAIMDAATKAQEASEWIFQYYPQQMEIAA
jgi:antirestriction protein ArdC